MKLSKKLRHQALKIIVPTLGFGLFYGIGKSSKDQVFGGEQVQELKERYGRLIFVGWHEHVMTSAWMFRRRDVAILASQSQDGEYLARLNRMLGFYPVRGSSSRGGVRGMRQLIRALEDGHDVLLGPDGPRGPAKECKAGVILLAKYSGLPIVPCAGYASRCKHLKSWDRTVFPLPFSTITLGYGEPILVPRDADKATIAEYQISVRDALNSLQRDVSRRCRA